MHLLWLLAAALSAHPSPLHVLVDPGHGGRDHGAVRGPATESEIALSVSRKLADRLKRDRRFRVSLTRERDETLSLASRAEAARRLKADVFVSVHVNSNPDPRARGAEFYFQNQLPPDEESMFLAHKENAAEAGAATSIYPVLANAAYPPEVTAIVTDLLDNDRILRSSQLSTSLKRNWSGTRKSKSHSVRQAPFFVLSQMHTPSALVELGFITNPEDQRELTDPSNQAKMADDLYNGLVHYKESLDKSKATP